MKIIKTIVNILTWAAFAVCAVLLFINWNDIPAQVAVAVNLDNSEAVAGDKMLLPVFLLGGAGFNLLTSFDLLSNSLFRAMNNAGAPRSVIDGMVCIFQCMIAFTASVFTYMAISGIN